MSVFHWASLFALWRVVSRSRPFRQYTYISGELLASALRTWKILSDDVRFGEHRCLNIIEEHYKDATRKWPRRMSGELDC
ncbi:hypothetical protein BKA83DRAFT_4365728 [Pisolithus microcarpus]|nr:hypothetical protein BKA83DRAFT_4365728 [Pisolithus microcarpus]